MTAGASARTMAARVAWPARRALTLASLVLGGLVLSLTGHAAKQAQTLRGSVTRVVDGDTLWFQPENAASPLIAVRLRGIDAPETCQAWGPQSRAALKTEVEGRAVTLRTHGNDDYRRTVGTVRRDGVDINRLLVERGHAWAWRDARGRGPYVAAEQAARDEARGLFGDPRAEPPWEFRRYRGRCGR